MSVLYSPYVDIHPALSGVRVVNEGEKEKEVGGLVNVFPWVPAVQSIQTVLLSLGPRIHGDMWFCLADWGGTFIEKTHDFTFHVKFHVF